MLAWRVGQKHKSGANVVGVGVRRGWISHRFCIKAVVLHKEKPPRPLNRDAMNSKIVIHWNQFSLNLFFFSGKIQIYWYPSEAMVYYIGHFHKVQFRWGH